MINAYETMLLLSKRYDGEQRRAVYDVKVVTDCSSHEVSADEKGSGYSAKAHDLSVRIPNVSRYLPEGEYERQGRPSDKWTVKTQDLLILLIHIPDTIPETLYEDEATAFASAYGYHRKAYRVREYADNSRRGSVLVRHIRIVGE